MDPEIIITGTGRCGTGYFANLLNEVGILCTHEGYFTPEGPQPVDVLADSSWMAAPFLEQHPRAKLIMAVRSPQAVVRSLMGIAFFQTEGPYQKFALCHEPDLAEMDPVTACWEWWVRWNQRILAHSPDVIVGVSDVQRDWVPELSALLGVREVDMREAVRRLPPTNSRHRYKRPIQRGVTPVIQDASDLWESLRWS